MGKNRWTHPIIYCLYLPRRKLCCFWFVSLYLVRPSGRDNGSFVELPALIAEASAVGHRWRRTWSPLNPHCSCEAHPAEAIFRRKLVCILFVCLCWGGGGSLVMPQPQVPRGRRYHGTSCPQCVEQREIKQQLLLTWPACLLNTPSLVGTGCEQ